MAEGRDAAMSVVLLAVALGLGGWLAFSKRLAKSDSWQATLTPLASIMGSGFLISAPLLGGVMGHWAVFGIAALLVVAYFVGGAIRFNIRSFEPVEHKKGVPQTLALVSRWALVAAYFISVVYYLELLAAFVLKNLGIEGATEANLIVSGILVLIGGIGMTSGLSLLEKLERYTVSLNLGMVGALLVALAIYNTRLAVAGDWRLPNLDSAIDGQDLRILLGLLIVVQGFETSRYLGDKHSADQRVATMRVAQLLSGGIYLVFVALATVLFQPDMGADVTAILTLTAVVAAFLPIMLSVAAVGSQFSAAVADTAGAGGLVEDLSNNRLPQRWAYGIILAGTLGIAWLTDVNQIIATASRAFALFYALQCAVAAMMASRGEDRSVGLTIWFGLLSTLCLGIVVFGVASEG